MQSPKPILLIRHAESEYNLAQRLAIKSDAEVGLDKECQDTKFDPKLIDCGLSEEGISQCIARQKEIQETEIHYVLVSPLKRALQTAHYLFKDHPNQPKFIVLPELREMMMSSCDIGGNLTQSLNDFNYMDFTRLTSCSIISENPDLWCLQYCEDKEQANLAREYVLQRLQETKSDASLQQPLIFKELSPQFIVEFMKQTSPRYLELFSHTRSRVGRLRQVLQNELQKLPQDSKVACVSHSRCLHTLSSSEFDEIGLPTNGIWWKNCEGKSMEF